MCDAIIIIFGFGHEWIYPSIYLSIYLSVEQWQEEACIILNQMDKECIYVYREKTSSKAMIAASLSISAT